MKYSPDMLCFTRRELVVLAQGLADVIAETQDPFAERVLNYLVNINSLTCSAHQARRKYLTGIEVPDDELTATLESSGPIYCVIPDDFMVGALKTAADHLKSNSQQYEETDSGNVELVIRLAAELNEIGQFEIQS